ncbi:MAG: 50S ribosomal protein L32 [Candidatus Gracilibacteria bacterium]|jgi:ribosomal protein L32
MAKHPVPKKKVSNARSAQRFASFKQKKYRKIKNFVNIIKCKACGNPALNQQACPKCGNYRGRSTRDAKKVVEKITKVKA